MSVKVYIDALGPGGAYRACTEPSELAYDPLARQLVLPRFAEALGYRPLRAGWRLFHVERMRFLPGDRIDQDVSPLHTLVVVNCVDPLHASPETIRMLWELTGGADRLRPSNRPATVRAPEVAEDGPVAIRRWS